MATIAVRSDSDRAITERRHVLIGSTAGGPLPRTWTGMPAYSRDEQVVCFIQTAQRFKTRYATLGFGDEANLDEVRMWPASYSISELGPPRRHASRRS